MRKRITWRYITLAGLMALGLTGCGASSKGAATEAAVADSAYLSDDMYIMRKLQAKNMTALPVRQKT